MTRTPTGVMRAPDPPGTWLIYGTMIVRAVATVFTMPIEMLVRPRCGTRYFSLPTIVSTWIVLEILVAVSSIASVFSSPSTAPVGMNTILLLFDAGCVIHFLRLRPLFKDMKKEVLSVDDGPGLPFIDRLPHGDEWLWARVVYEPAGTLIVAIVLNRFNVLSGLATFYLCLGSVALFVKTGSLYYDSWCWFRDIADGEARAQAAGEFSQERQRSSDSPKAWVVGLDSVVGGSHGETNSRGVDAVIGSGNGADEGRGEDRRRY